jgi:hypothetical protein
MNDRSTSADFVTAFATGWPENQPDIMVLSLTTHRGVQDFAFKQGTGAVGRKNHDGNRRPVGPAKNGLALDDVVIRRPSRLARTRASSLNGEAVARG